MRTSIAFVLAVVSAVAGAQTPGVPGPCLPNMDDGFDPGLTGSCCSVVMNPLLPMTEIPPDIHMPGQYAVFVNSVGARSLAQVAQTGNPPFNPANIVFEFSK